MHQEANIPISVFISYAPQDEALFSEFETYLSPLQKRGFITMSHRGKVDAGSKRREILDAALETAMMILMLISANFLADDECEMEIQHALARHETGETIVIPIFLRPVPLEDISLTEFQCLPRNGQPITRYPDRDEAWQEVVIEIRKILKKGILQPRRGEERKRKLNALIADHHGFMQDRLNSFVGRESELAEIQSRILEKLKTGGYVTITGQAGQGKSSIIAKLVEKYGQDSVAFHFIPLKPGPDHQVGLLRNLMARLILKYDLSDLYIANDNRAALRDYFPKVLQDIVIKGKQELIFVDGLDQLEEDLSGFRDLSFLPNNPPPGIVFVLGTRPDDTLRPLELLKPLDEYRLPNLSRQDFDLILQYRQVYLDHQMVGLFYKAMQENALYLDLVAKELMEREVTSPQEMIAQLTHNPDALFSLSIARFKRYPVEWREVIKPILGILLVARDPLSLWHIRQILQIEDDRLRDGLIRLGGLIVEDGNHRYSLFHMKLRDYLRQDKHNPHKEYIFALDEEEHWHHILATWCKNDNLLLIWENVKGNLIEQGRREYARQHYIAHLYGARERHLLFEVLDEGEYGKAKLRHDPSMRSYALDLDMGRQAAMWKEGTIEQEIALLSKLWQYTLLRCSLMSKADNYPLTAFQLLLLLKKEQGALNLAELLTQPSRKIDVLLKIATHLAEQSDRKGESIQIIMRAEAVAYTIEEDWLKYYALEEIGVLFARIGQYKLAEILMSKIQKRQQREQLFWRLIATLTETEQWQQAKELAYTINDSRQKAWILSQLGIDLVKTGQWEHAAILWAEVEAIVSSITERRLQVRAFREFAIVLTLIQQWDRAEAVIHMIIENDEQSGALRTLGIFLARAKQWEHAKAILVEAEVTTRNIKDISRRLWGLSELSAALVMIRQWDRAEAIWNEVEANWLKAEASVREVQESDKRNQALQELSTALTQVGQWRRAEALIRTIRESKLQDQALQELGIALVKAEQWERAEALIRTIRESKLQDQALQELGIALVKAEQWERIEIIINKFKCKDVMLHELGINLAHAEKWNLSEVVIRIIQENKVRSQTLQELAIILSQAKQWKRAEIVWVEAEIASRMIKEKDKKIEALSHLGFALAQAGKQSHAEILWTEIEMMMHQIQEGDERAQALRELSVVLAQAEQWDYAEAIAYTIQDDKIRNNALQKLGIYFVHNEQWQRIGPIVYKIQERGENAQILRGLSAILIQAGQWKQAETVLHKIQENDEKDKALRELGTALAQAGQWKQAEIVLHKIQEDSERSQALQDMGIALAQLRYWEYADELCAEAKVAACLIKEVNKRTQILGELQAQLARMRQQERAEAIIRFINESRYQIQTFYEQEMILTRKGQKKQAEIVRKQAETLTRMIEEVKPKIQALEALASVLSYLGRQLQIEDMFAEIEFIWTQAMALASTIEDINFRVEALWKLGKALLEAGQQKQAETVWKQAEVVIGTISESHKRVPLLQGLGKVLAHAGKWKHAEEIVNMIEDTKARNPAILDLGRVLVQEGQWKWAEMLVDTMEESYEKTQLLQELGKALAKMKDWEYAEKVISTIKDFRDRSQNFQYLIKYMDKYREYSKMIYLVQRLWLQADIRENAIELLALANPFISSNPDIGFTFCEAFTWVDSVLKL